MTHPIIITFAGAVGTSKTPIASFLSWNTGLPVFNTDAIRSEVTEDLLQRNEAEQRRRRNERLERILKDKISFICDASMDREWVNLRPKLEAAGYRWCIISLDFSKALLEKIYQAKDYQESLPRLDTLIAQHDEFLPQFGHDVAFHLTDEQFSDRLELSLAKVQDWLKAAS